MLELCGVSKLVMLIFIWILGVQLVFIGKVMVKCLDFGVGGGDWVDIKIIFNEIVISIKVVLKVK